MQLFLFRSVTLEKCHNSTIVLGTVKTTVNVFGCENVTVIALCNRLTVRLGDTFSLFFSEPLLGHVLEERGYIIIYSCFARKISFQIKQFEFNLKTNS